MSIVVTRLFDTYEQAAQAVAELERTGIPHSDISLVANNVEGRYGDYHATDRTAGSVLWINPLMSLCWCFDLGAVGEQILVRGSRIENRGSR